MPERGTRPLALITGAGRGIGRATAEALAAEGYRLVLAEVRPALGRRTARALARRGAEVLFVRTDGADARSVERMAREVRRRCGPVAVSNIRHVSRRQADVRLSVISGPRSSMVKMTISGRVKCRASFRLLRQSLNSPTVSARRRTASPSSSHGTVRRSPPSWGSTMSRFRGRGTPARVAVWPALPAAGRAQKTWSRQ